MGPFKKNSNAYKMLEALVKAYPNAISTNKLRYIVSNTSTYKGVLDGMGLKINTYKDVLTFSYAIDESSIQLARKFVDEAEIVISNPRVIPRLTELQECNEELFKKNTVLQENINYLGEENRRLVARLNSLSNQLLEVTAKADKVQSSLVQLERYQQIEDIVKSRINNNTQL